MSNFRIINLSGTNCYLLGVDSGFLLVDCGRAHDGCRLLKALGQLGVSLQDIRYLFLTHHHNDHCGLLGFLAGSSPGMRVILSASCADRMAAGVHFRHDGEVYANNTLQGLFKIYSQFDRHWSERFSPYCARECDIIIREDNVNALDCIGAEGKILMTPGHTDDSISLVTGSVAFVGDAARNMLNFTGMPYYPIIYSDKEACRKSWRRLLEAGARTICPAHGRPFGVDKPAFCNSLDIDRAKA